MAKITNLSTVIGKLGLLAVLLFSAIVSANANTNETASNAQRKAARIKEAEETLSNLGYWITKVDGKSDDSTRQGIIAFQKVEGLKRTGVLDDRMLRVLRLATRPVPKHKGAAHRSEEL